jgi:LAGLIDADG-like domain
MEIKSTEFFKNIKKLPPPGSEEFKQLIDWEIEKCTGGITINGVHISPWLYWHINHWWIRLDDVDEYGNDIRKKSLPELRDNEWIRAEHLEKCRLQRKGYIEIGGRQGAKDLINTSLLYQEEKEITIGACSVGDQIYDESGNLTTIIGKYPQGIKPVYKVTLLDGREILCGLEHNWFVKDRLTKKKNKTCVKTTKDLLENYKRVRPSWGHRKNSFEFRYSLPNNEPVKYSEKKQLLDPYFLGLWLGDGSNYYSKITSVDTEIIDYLYQYAASIGLQITVDDVDTFMITSGKQGGRQNQRNIVHSFLKEKQLYQNKHIPHEYLYGSIEQRMELLRGLMDSDGSCDVTGSIEFSSSIPKLAEDFYKLCRSLGIVLSKKIRKTSYKKNGVKISCKDTTKFTLYTDKKVFKLSRKLEKIKCKPKYKDWVGICNIEYIGDSETTCILVDNESHLFLTDNYTVTHNSECEASYFGMNAILFQNSQNVIVCGNDNDLSLLKDKVDFGLKNLWEGINIPRLDKTWRSNQVKLGYKKPNGDDEIWSYIVIRNAKDGHNTEVAAGTTAKSFIMDEVGKYSFASAFQAAEPAFKGKNGWRAVPILMGTGGSFDNGKDAENFFYNPESNNFLAVERDNEKKTGLFLSGIYRQDCKEQKKLGDWLREEGKITTLHTPELDDIVINVANKEKAISKISQERESLKTNPDRTLYLKQVMYFPLTPEECFLSSQENMFNIESAKRQQSRLYQQEKTGTPVILYQDENEIKFEHTDTLPISNFPLRPNDSKNAPVVIYEHPPENPPYGLYVAGIDPYRQGKSAYSSSLGAVYIYKRMNSLVGEKYQDMFVASYCARPDKKETWEEQARLLIKYYNARALCENDEISFIDYMISKGDARFLEKQPQWLKEIVPNTTVAREFGIHRSAEKIRNHLHNCIKKYMEETLVVEKDEEGNIIKEVLGINRILDPVLLEEIIQYNDDLNTDRLVAAELAIALAMHMDPIYGRVQKTQDTRIMALTQKRVKQSLFSSGSTLFKNKNKFIR